MAIACSVKRESGNSTTRGVDLLTHSDIYPQ